MRFFSSSAEKNRRRFVFEYGVAAKSGFTAEKANYDLIYTGTLPQAKPVPSTLEDLYVTFNQNCQEDFCGHSLSVSDIVAIKHYGMVSCHYLDSVGYQALPAFWTPENYLKTRKCSWRTTTA